MPLSKEERGFVPIVVGILSQYRSSQFEFEGACRNALRSSFCIFGFDFETAEDVAQRIVQAGLDEIGARRPTWEQANRDEWQSELTDWTRCCHCGKNIPDDRGSRNGIPVKYCSYECGVSAYQSRVRASEERVSKAEWLATCAARKERTRNERARPCDYCGNTFVPERKTQSFCSTECGNKGKDYPRKLSEIDCIGCGKSFKPKLADQKYCSNDCWHKNGRESNIPEKTCPVCGTKFRVHSVKLEKTHCSRKCSWVTRRLQKAAVAA